MSKHNDSPSIPRERWHLEDWYDVYLEQRARSRRYAERMGGKPRAMSASSFEAFAADFETLITDENYLKRGGKAAAQALAKRETLPISHKQALVTAKAYKERTGTDESLSTLVDKYYTGAAEKQYKDIEYRREQLFKEGKSKYEVRTKISEEFYGSE